MERKQKINCEIDSISDDLKAMARYLYENRDCDDGEERLCIYCSLPAETGVSSGRELSGDGDCV